MPEGQPILEWTVNALIPGAEPNSEFARASFVFDPRGRGIFKAVLGGFKKLQGGLWVGGRLHAGDDRLTFVPNALNAGAVDGATSVSIPFDRITGIHRRFGFLSGIVDVETQSGPTHSFRTFGAEKLARILAERVRTHP